MGKKVTIDQIAKAYEKKGGNVSATCLALGMSRQCFYTRKEKSKELRERLDEIDEALLDFAESKLIQHINDGNLTALLFFLKTKGKKRGYVEQIDNKLVENPFEKLMKELGDD